MELLTAEELTEMLHLKNKKTVINMLYSGTLPKYTTVKIGRLLRFSKEKINEWLEDCRCTEV